VEASQGCHERSEKYPEKLNELVQEYGARAKRNKVLSREEVQKLPKLQSGGVE